MSLNTDLTNTSFKSTELDSPAVNRQAASEFHQQMIEESQQFEFMEKKANVMASSVATIPKHLQGNSGDCMAIILMAHQWGMNPYSVAQKTHLINGVMGYEAQLVNAVVSSSNKIIGSFDYEWFGPWENIIGKVKMGKNGQGKEYIQKDWKYEDEVGLGIRVKATLRGETEPRVLELLLLQAQVRNSTLWASDPKQQLAYLGVKRWSRLYAPDVILGVYSPDELHVEKDITPKPSKVVEQYSNNGDENLFIKLSEDIKATTSIAQLNKVKQVMVDNSDRLNNSQRESLSGLYKDHGAMMQHAKDTEKAAAAAGEK